MLVPMTLSTVSSAPRRASSACDWGSASTADTKRFAAYFTRMLERGIYLAPSQFEALFLSLAHTDDQIDRTVALARETLKSMRWAPEA